MAYPLTIWTIRSQHENGYTVSTWCPKCKACAGELDHAKLIAAGYGERPPLSLRLRCRTCREVLQLTVQPPSRHLAASGAAPTSDAAPPAP